MADLVLRVGCPMWAHRPWIGRFYPPGTKPGTELGLYTSWCNAVEGNTTFYAEPSPSTVADAPILRPRRPSVFVHQPENLDSPQLACAFHDAVRQRCPTLAALPDPVGQTSLF